MSELDFKYRPVLEDLTETVNDQGLDPLEAYAVLLESQRTEGLVHETYASTSITSGGHAHDDSLEIREIIEKNTLNALWLAEELAKVKQIYAPSTIEPVAVGKTHWKQSQYMEFWLLTLAQAELSRLHSAGSVDKLRQKVLSAYDKNGVDLSMLNSKQSPEVRAPEYFKQANSMADVAIGLEMQPAKRIVRLIDPDTSLGAQAENYFGSLLDIDVMKVAAMQTISPQEAAINSLQKPELRSDISRLVRFGATVFDVTTRNQLVLVPDEEAA